MSFLDGWRHRWRVWTNPRQHERDLVDEMEFHVEREAARQSQRARTSISSEDTVVAARRQVGNLTWAKEETRRATGLASLDAFRQDVRFALRSFRRTPVFTAIVVVTLALGIGFTTGIYSAIDALLLRPLPFWEPERLMSVSLRFPGSPGRREVDNVRWSYAKVAPFRAAQTSFSNLTVWMQSQFTVRLGEKAYRVEGEYTDSHYFPTLGIPLALGQNFPESDNLSVGGERAIILGYGLWRGNFGGDSTIIGKTMLVDGNPYVVVGVSAPDFRGLSGVASIWMPANSAPVGWANSEPYNHNYFLVARLAPGVTVERAIIATPQLGAVVDAQFPTEIASQGHWSASARKLDATRAAPLVKRMLFILLGAVLLMLLTTCANVANLLLVRASTRQREVAVRLALGATRARVARQLLAESLVLAILGGVGSLAIAYLSVKALASVQTVVLGRINAFSGIGTVHLSAIQFDVGAFAVVMVLSLLTGLVFGFAPALHATRTSFIAATKEGGNAISIGTRRFTLRHALTVTEITFAVVLLAGSGLMLRSVDHLKSVRPGFDQSRILALRVNRAPEWSRDSITTYYDGVMEKLAAVAGVTGVAMADCAPLDRCATTGVFVSDRPAPDLEHTPVVGMHWISPSWPALLKIPLLRGRLFTRNDDRRAPLVTLISESAANRLWPGEDAIGRRLAFTSGDLSRDTATVIGIVGDVRYDSMNTGPEAEVYLSYYQTHFTYRMMLFVQGRPSANDLIPGTVSALRAYAPGFPVHEVASLQVRMDESTAYVRITTAILTVFAAVALLLAMMGTYGVVAYTVSQRTREIGVRVALGATNAHISKLVMTHAITLASVGLGVGLTVAVIATRALRSLLYEVAPSDPATLLGIMLILGASVLAATWFPARKAMRVMPSSVLRAP